MEDALTRKDSASWPIKKKNDPSEEFSVSWQDKTSPYSIPGFMVLLAAKELVTMNVSACVGKPTDLLWLMDMPKKLHFSCLRRFCDVRMKALRVLKNRMPKILIFNFGHPVSIQFLTCTTVTATSS